MTAISGTFRARAKINLGLEVLGRRPDGYHALRTVFQTIDLADTIRIRVGPRPGPVTIRCDDPSVPSDHRNLAYRAAMAIRAAAGPGAARETRIEIRKRIPAGGGLGGGSSDAATVLAALDRLLGLGLSRGRLERLARALGADVPFFLSGGTALGTARGDRVRPLRIDVPPYAVLVQGPGGVSTAAVFAAFRAGRRRRSPIRQLLLSRSKNGRTRALRGLVNDLESAAVVVSPDLARVRRLVREASAAGGGACASMSGSGSAFFVLAESTRVARRVARELRDRGLLPATVALVRAGDPAGVPAATDKLGRATPFGA